MIVIEMKVMGCCEGFGLEVSLWLDDGGGWPGWPVLGPRVDPSAPASLW